VGACQLLVNATAAAIERIADGETGVATGRLVNGDICYARDKITDKDVANGER